MEVYAAKQLVIVHSLSLQASRLHFELHPDDAYGDAEVELHGDMLWGAVAAYYVLRTQLDQP